MKKSRPSLQHRTDTDPLVVELVQFLRRKGLRACLGSEIPRRKRP